MDDLIISVFIKACGYSTSLVALSDLEQIQRIWSLRHHGSEYSASTRFVMGQELTLLLPS